MWSHQNETYLGCTKGKAIPALFSKSSHSIERSRAKSLLGHSSTTIESALTRARGLGVGDFIELRPCDVDPQQNRSESITDFGPMPARCGFPRTDVSTAIHHGCATGTQHRRRGPFPLKTRSPGSTYRSCDP